METVTSLPDLPFSNYGDTVVSSVHSSAEATPRAYPRTDLQTLTPWRSFLEDIHQAIQSAMTMHADLSSAPLQIAALTVPSVVVNEETLRAHAMYALHLPVQQVANKLGVAGSFRVPGGGNAAIIGAPDFSWIMSEEHQPHPKLIIEYKTWWAAPLVDLPAIHARRGDHLDTLSQQSLDALEQTYGYMTFNNNKFGILTNWRRAWFLRRAETSERKTLEYFVVELGGSSPPISMLKAWVGMLLLTNDTWFYASPTLSSTPSGQNFGGTLLMVEKAGPKGFIDAEEYHSRPDNGQYQCLALDFHRCCFDLSSARDGSHGCVVTAQFLKPNVLRHHLQVFCKVVDVLRYPHARDLLEHEVTAYATLHNLQGQVIPKVYGFYQVWGILRILALEPVGDAIPEDERIDQELRQKMKAALQRIHDTWHIHGDIARRNFCRKNGDVFLVDLEMCRRAENQTELDSEMNRVDRL